MKTLARSGLVAMLSVLLSCSEPPQNGHQKASHNTEPQPYACQVTVGWEPWEPYMYLTPGNQVSGLDIEIINAIAEQANCGLTYVQSDWRGLLRKIEAGEIDVVPGASVSESRKAFALFSTPYREENFVLYVRPEEADMFKSTIEAMLADGKKFGTTMDYLYGDDLGRFQDNVDYRDQFIA